MLQNKLSLTKTKKVFSTVFVLLIAVALLGLSFLIASNTKRPQGGPVNLDGDLKLQLSSSQRDLIWKGKFPNTSDWFSGNEGFSTFELGYDFTDPQNPFGTCKIDFVDAYGNRPMPFMSTSYGAFPKIFFNSTINPTIHFDIKMLNFTTKDFMRTAAVVVLMDNSGHKYYFEQDIKDGPNEIQQEVPTQPSVDHFDFSTISSPQTTDVPFSIRITAKDQSGNRVDFNGQVFFGDYLGSIPSGVTITFRNGVWSGSGALHIAGTDYNFVATLDGSVRSQSNTFDVIGTAASANSPVLNSDGGVWEKVYGSVALNKWTHFDIPFSSFINSIKSFEPIRDNCFIESFYLVNECFGNGYVSYDVKNWWLTV